MPRRKNKEEHSEVIENAQSSKVSEGRKKAKSTTRKTLGSNLTNKLSNKKHQKNSSSRKMEHNLESEEKNKSSKSKSRLSESRSVHSKRGKDNFQGKKSSRSNIIEKEQPIIESVEESIDWSLRWEEYKENLHVWYTRARPIIQYGIIVFSIFLGISLLSFNPMDLRSVHSSQSITNAGGILGAFLSKQLLTYLGFGAWSCLFIGGLQILSLAKRPVGTIYHYLAGFGMLWALLGMIALIHPAATSAGYYPSGIIGYETQSLLVLIVGTGGSWIFLLSMLFLLGIYIVGLDLQDAASQSLDQIQEVGPPMGYRTLEYFKNTYYDISDGLHSIDFSAFAFWRKKSRTNDELDDPSSYSSLESDIRDFVQDSIEEDSYENEYSYDYGSEFSQEYSVEEQEDDSDLQSEEVYSEDVYSEGVYSEEVDSYQDNSEKHLSEGYDSFDGSFEEMSDVVFTQDFSKQPQKNIRKSVLPKNSLDVEDSESRNMATSIQKQHVVEVVWDPTIFSDPNLQDTKAMRNKASSNPTTHEAFVDIDVKTEDFVVKPNPYRSNQDKKNLKNVIRGDSYTKENEFHQANDENWQQELSEWYIPEEDRSFEEEKLSYEAPIFHEQSDEIDLDRIDVNDLQYDDSFLDQLFVNLKAKKGQEAHFQGNEDHILHQKQSQESKQEELTPSKEFQNKRQDVQTQHCNSKFEQLERRKTSKQNLKVSNSDQVGETFQPESLMPRTESPANQKTSNKVQVTSSQKQQRTESLQELSEDKKFEDENDEFENDEDYDNEDYDNEDYDDEDYDDEDYDDEDYDDEDYDDENDDDENDDDENDEFSEVFYSEDEEEVPAGKAIYKQGVQVQVPPISRNRSFEEDVSDTDNSLDVIPDSELQFKSKEIDVCPGNIQSGGKAEFVENYVNPFEDFVLPSLSVFDEHETDVAVYNEAELREMAVTLENKFLDFNVKGEVMSIRPGPVITTFEFKPARGIRVSKVAGLADDIAMALSAIRVRIVAPIPGRDVVGIEIPNDKRQVIWALDMFGSKNFQESEGTLTMCLGKTVEGIPYVCDLAKMPHLLVGGTTGSGKSVGINTMIVSLLMKRSPEDLRLILIDPKMLEFEMYHDIPHLIYPVVTDPHMANGILKWACDEMDRRYALMAKFKTRTIESFNKRLKKELEDWNDQKALELAPLDWDGKGKPPKPKKMPYIVCIIDELADLMMVAGKDVEAAIIRLAQKARACGIHLIVATQRPSVDVITGMIKANMPSRISFQVRQKQDSRTILGENGGETLLGKGDMLFLPPGVANLTRCHGPFLTDEEVRAVTDYLRSQAKPVYEAKIPEEEVADGLAEDEAYDEYYALSVQFVIESRKASTSMIQRKFKIGYNRAARIIEVMESESIVASQDGSKPRKVLIDSMPEHLIDL